MAAAMTRDQIVLAGLRQAGNTSIISQANDHLANFLDRLYDEFRWEFLKQTTSGVLTAGTGSYNLPADFEDVWNEVAFRIEEVDTPGKGHHLIIEEDGALFVLNDLNATGEPEIVVFNFNLMQFGLWPIPDKAYNYKLAYKFKPARLTTNIAPVFPNDQLLIQAVYVFALQHEDDDRFGPELGLLNAMIKRMKKGENLSKTKKEVVRLSPKRFKRISAYR